MSLEKLMNYRWELSLGEQTLSPEEFETLASLKSSLSSGCGASGSGSTPNKSRKRWSSSLAGAPRPRMARRELSPQEALRLGLGGIEQVEGLEVEEAAFEDWLAGWFERLGGADGERKLGTLPTPADLRADLRPYQQAGYSWLAFLKGSALGACLADDMGLGKTVQTLALFSRDQEQDLLKAPVLVVCPTSVVSNWHKEAQLLHPEPAPPDPPGSGQATRRSVRQRTGADRPCRNQLRPVALGRRDVTEGIEWHAVVLDEAQNIKNPEAKQSKLAYGLQSGFRLVLTGTPVENRLAELWSIMRFLNPWISGLPEGVSAALRPPDRA